MRFSCSIRCLRPSGQPWFWIPPKLTFLGTDPNLFLEALRLVSAEDSRFHDARQEAWDSVAGVNFQDYDAAYVDWVVALPESVDREMALLALARAAEKKDGQLAARLRAEIKSRPE